MRSGKQVNGSRANALWGKAGRHLSVAVAAVACLLLASAVAVGAPAPTPAKVPALKLKAYLPGALLSAVQQNPRATYDVIVQGDPRGRASTFFKKAFQDSAARGQAIQTKQIKRQ